MTARFVIAWVLLGAMILARSVDARQEESALSPIGAEAFEVMREFFRYDESIPLEPRVVESSAGDGLRREKIVFRGVRDSRVPGYLAVPRRGEKPFPCVILIHGIGGSKEGWWGEGTAHSSLVDRLVEQGCAVLTLDCQYHGERLGDNDFESPTVFTFERGWLRRTRDMVVQSVVEHRRAIDLVAERPDIDGTRIGCAGYSMGGMMTFLLTGVEPRVRAAVACVPPILKEPHSAIAVHNFAPRINDRPLLMLMGTNDPRNYSSADARHVYELVDSSKKDLVFYEGGHVLPPEWVDRAATWLFTHLK